MSMGISSAFAASITINSTADTDEAATETTEYTAWKLLDADIETAPTVNLDGETTNQDSTKVAYFTTSASAKAALETAGLFTFTQVGSEDKWYATPKENLTAAEVTGAFASWTEAQMTAAFGEPATGAQTAPKGSATINVTDPGYYYIKSTLGDEIAVQTLADVEINTKNSYTTDDKTVDSTDEHAQIGDEISYTLTVNVAASANDVIVLTDTMDEGLTFKSVDSIKAGEDDVTGTVAPNTAAAVTANGNKFTITFDAATVKANQGKTITIEYTAVLNNKAVVESPVKNKLDLKYGNNYEAVPKEVETKTHKFTFDKVDGSTKLTGAEFNLQIKGGAVLDLVEVTAGEVYRVATAEDTTTTKTIVTAGKTITINGVDSDVTYQLVETKAPAGGYNKLEQPKDVTVDAGNSTHVDVENNKGTVLPSTGGIGTTIFYVVGSILVVAAGVLLVTKKRMSREG